MSKSRERANDFDSVCGAMKSLISELVRYELTHEKFLELRDSRIFKHEAWPRLTGAHQQEILGMGRGALEALHVNAIVWCHFYEGRFQTSHECHLDPKFAYAIIDTDKSRHCWRDSRKPFAGR